MNRLEKVTLDKDNPEFHTDIPRLRKGGVGAQVSDLSRSESINYQLDGPCMLGYCKKVTISAPPPPISSQEWLTSNPPLQHKYSVSGTNTSKETKKPSQFLMQQCMQEREVD